MALQDKQLRGAITFEEACADLHHRCEAIRADELLATSVRGQARNPKALVSTQGKRQNKVTSEIEMAPCLQLGCDDMVKMYLPLCPLHYHQCISGKCSEVELKDGLGKAKFNGKTQVIDYPSTVPKNRFPLQRAERPSNTRKVLVFQDEETNIVPDLPILFGVHESVDISGPSFATFYVDSGAGQCLCSCSTAFVTMEACHLQVVGVAGRLTIHGKGTAVFIASASGQEVLLRIHNCLHSFGTFNLISVSQLKMVSGDSVNFSVENPFMKFSQSQLKIEDCSLLDCILCRWNLLLQAILGIATYQFSMLRYLESLFLQLTCFVQTLDQMEISFHLFGRLRFFLINLQWGEFSH